MEPGFRYLISAGQVTRTRISLFELQSVERDPGKSVDRLSALLDQAINSSSTERQGAVLFSGGVDSGLIAARMAALGWKDVVLAHSTRGDGDEETVAAREMARCLDMPFESFPYDPNAAMELLPRIFAARVPVNDFSILPVWQLADQVAAVHGGAMWDGSAADALFGGLGKWRRAAQLYRVPRIVRQAVGAAYRLGLWKSPSGKEDFLRIIRRTAHWPYPWFALALNPLAGIAYRAAAREEITTALDEWLVEVAGDLGDARPKVIGVVQGNCGCHCQKLFSVVGGRARFPFLSPDLVAYALKQAEVWPSELGEGKGVLKRLLMRQVPSGLVLREKSGFSVPPASLFATPSFLAALDEVIEDGSGPLADIIDRSFLRRARAALAQRRLLAWYTYEFLWQTVFGHQWMKHPAAGTVIAMDQSAGESRAGTV